MIDSIFDEVDASDTEIGNPWHSSEPATRYRTLFPVFPNYSAFDTVGFPEEAIGLPKTATLHLKKKVFAAAIANKLGISLNYAEKAYVKDDISPPRELGLSRDIDGIFQYGQSRFQKYIEELKFHEKETEKLSDLSSQFFYRSLGGFEASKKLSELGYLCEVAVILRLLIEQFALSAKLRTVPIDADLHKIRPVKCLAFFTSIEPTAGRLYGILSKYTHFEFDHHTHFFARTKDGIFTIQKDAVLRAYATHLLFMTMRCVARYVLKVADQQFVKLPADVPDLASFANKVVQYSEEVCRRLPGDRVLNGFHKTISITGKP